MSEKESQLKCQTKACKAERAVFCMNHKTPLCICHRLLFHRNCEINYLWSSSEIRLSLEVIGNTLKTVQKYSLPKDSEDFDGFLTELSILKRTAGKVLEKDKVKFYPALQEKIDDLLSCVKESEICEEAKDLIFSYAVQNIDTPQPLPEVPSNFEIVSPIIANQTDFPNTELVQTPEENLEEEDKKNGKEEENEEEIDHPEKEAIEETEEDIEDQEIEKFLVKRDPRKKKGTKVKDINKNKANKVANTTERGKQEGIYDKVSNAWFKINGFSNLCSSSKVVLDPSEERDRLFMELMIDRGERIPPVKQIKIDYLKLNDSLVNNFLLHCFPEEVELLYLESDYSTSNPGLNFYFENLKEAIPSVTREVFFNGFRMTSEEFEAIFELCKAPRLILEKSEIAITSPIELINDCITHLSFQNTNYRELENWADDSDASKNIFEAIAKSEMADTLEQINMSSCGISILEVQGIATKVGLEDKICAEGEDWDPTED